MTRGRVETGYSTSADSMSSPSRPGLASPEGEGLGLRVSEIDPELLRRDEERFAALDPEEQRFELWRGYWALCETVKVRDRPPQQPASILPTYLPPLTTEARYARSRGRYGRHRSGDDDHAALNAQRPSWSWSAAHWTVGTAGTLAPGVYPTVPHTIKRPISRAASRPSRARARQPRRQRETPRHEQRQDKAHSFRPTEARQTVKE